MNTRRDFLKHTGLALGATCAASSLPPLSAAPVVTPSATTATDGRPVLVAVRDGSRAAMLDKAMAELGGMGAFVKPGQSVVIKPNIGWSVPPERGGNTHPELVKRLVELCFAAGAKSVSVFDKTCNPWRECYKISGIEAAAKEAGAEVVPGNDDAYYREVAIPGGKFLKKTLVHRLVLECDVFINAPVLKHHSGSLMTASMKNLMGVISDRKFYHTNDLHQCIADFCTFKRPHLNVLDAYHPMFRNGPRGKSVEDLVEKRTLLVSTDIVAIDAAAARLLDHAPEQVTHVKHAAAMGLGLMDLSRVDIRRLQIA